MRISSRQMVDHVVANLHRNYLRLDRLQRQLSTGKRVEVPSDDPAAATTAMRLRSFVRENQQYLDNAQAAIAWLTATDTALQDVASTLHRARELTINAARSDLPPDARQALATEMDQLIRHLVQVANTTHGGRYIFGGTKTTAPPYQIAAASGQYVDGVAASGDDAEFEYEIGPGVTQPVNVRGSLPFGANAALFTTLITIRQHIESGDVASLSGNDLQQLDDGLERVLEAMSLVGARQEGFELVAQRLQGQEVNLKELLSKAEDLDVAQAIMDLKMQENVYRLALASGARVIQPTLLDFLR